LKNSSLLEKPHAEDAQHRGNADRQHRHCFPRTAARIRESQLDGGDATHLATLATRQGLIGGAQRGVENLLGFLHGGSGFSMERPALSSRNAPPLAGRG